VVPNPRLQDEEPGLGRSGTVYEDVVPNDLCGTYECEGFCMDVCIGELIQYYIQDVYAHVYVCR